MKVYYLNHEKFQSGDTITALQCAFDLAKNDKSIDTITLLVYQQNQYVPFLYELGFKPMHYKNHIALIEGYQVQIHTVKTYHPSYQFACHPQSEILVAVGVPPKHLEKFEDYSNIKYWVFVPWLMDESREWLSIFEAEDIETGQTKIPPAAADARIVEAIKWLNNTSYPNEGYHNPLDEDRLHQVANAIKRYKVPFNYASTVYSALHQGQIPSAARNTAEAFLRAQTRAFNVQYGSYDFSFLKSLS